MAKTKKHTKAKARNKRARAAAATAVGAQFSVPADRPSKQAVISVFGKTGYSLSWLSRAERMGDHGGALVREVQVRPARVFPK